MKRPARVLPVIAACAISPLILVLGIPFLALGAGVLSEPSSECPGSPVLPVDAPTIVGSSTLTAGDITDWWASARTPASPAVAAGKPVDELAATYIAEGKAENVRGDIAFAQAVLETGFFTSAGAEANNFAGIRHYDGRATGDTFPDPATGVRTHIQLLHKYASGNDVALAHLDVAPKASARATTWADLSGTWASSGDYWDDIARIYTAMLSGAGERSPAGMTPTECPDRESQAAAPSVAAAGDLVPLATVDGITVHQSLAAPLQSLLDAAERDGVHLTGWGYRSHQRQIELRREHCGSSYHATYQMPSSQCSPPTARPGSSMHEQGLAVDFDNCQTRATTCYRWLATHAASYGFYNLPSESWHWSSSGR